MPYPTSVISNEAMPTRVDVAIIGAGIAGVATALELTERGHRVAIFEKGAVACEQSSRNWGWCRQMGRDPRELPLIQISLQLWREMHQRTGEDVGFRECGIAYLCADEVALQKRQAWHDQYVAAAGLRSRMISAGDAQAMTPGATTSWLGGLYTPDDGRAEPELAVPAMARAAQKKGALIFQSCAVRTLDREGGRVVGVVTEHGRIKADCVILAGGAWSRRFCVNAGIELPQLTVVNSVMRTAPIDAGIDKSIAAGNFAIRKRRDRGYTLAHAIYNTAHITPDSFRLAHRFLPLLKDEWRDFKYRIGGRFLEEAQLKRRWQADETSPFEKVRMLDPTPNSSVQHEAKKALETALPVFQNAEIAEQWAGVIDVTPDAVPVISAVDAVPGFYLATGFSGHGFGLGPGAGRLMADIIEGTQPCVDPAPFAFGRW